MVGIGNIIYKLGEKKRVSELQGFTAELEKLRIVNNDRLWGWGYYCDFDGNYESQVVEGIITTLANIDDKHLDIDYLLICQPTLAQDSSIHDNVIKALAGSSMTKNMGFLGMAFSQCTNVLSAIDTARRLCSSNQYNVLIISAERIPDGETRIAESAIFSDYFMSLIVSSNPDLCDFEIIDSNIVLNVDKFTANDINNLGGLDNNNISHMLDRSNMEKRNIDKYLSFNLFKPVSMMKSKLIGFSNDQCFNDLQFDNAHCFGADPIINLLECSKKAVGKKVYLLNASGFGLSGAVLVKG